MAFARRADKIRVVVKHALHERVRLVAVIAIEVELATDAAAQEILIRPASPASAMVEIKCPYESSRCYGHTVVSLAWFSCVDTEVSAICACHWKPMVCCGAGSGWCWIASKSICAMVSAQRSGSNSARAKGNGALSGVVVLAWVTMASCSGTRKPIERMAVRTSANRMSSRTTRPSGCSRDEVQSSRSSCQPVPARAGWKSVRIHFSCTGRPRDCRRLMKRRLLFRPPLSTPQPIRARRRRPCAIRWSTALSSMPV